MCFQMGQRRFMQVRAMAIILVAAMALQASDGRAQSAGGLARKGNELYRQDRLKDAIEAYRQALALDPASGILQYNLGTAYARHGDLQDARTALGQAAEAPKSPHRQDSHFNLGVALAEQGMREGGLAAEPSGGKGAAGEPIPEGSDMPAAIDHLKEGLQSFRQSILVGPSDLEAKYNYELTQEMLKRLQQEQQRRQQQQDQQNQNKQQEQQQQNKQDENRSGGQGQEDQRQPNRQSQDQSKQQDDPANGPEQATPTATPTPQPSGSAQNSPKPQSPNSQSPNQSLTPEQMDAQRILNLLEEDKPDQFKRLLQYRGKPRERALDKDW
jgi:tetratricopeptide (TPR) repeat protein